MVRVRETENVLSVINVGEIFQKSENKYKYFHRKNGKLKKKN